MSSSSYSRRTSSLSTVPTACPQGPATRSRRPKVTTPTEERHSIRVVPSSTRSSLADRRTMEDKRSSYIRKRASAQSPFFSAGYRASSSSYRSPPAFLTEKQKRSRLFLSPSRANTIVKPDDDVEVGKEKEVPMTPSEEKDEPRFPGSLRKHRSTKSLAKQASKAKSPPRPATTVVTASTGMGRRASTRRSLLASELKASLNDLTGSEIYDNADLSESVYTDEEDDIENYNNRTTVKPGQFTLPPLNLDSRSSAQREKRRSKRNSHPKNDREMKRTSERDPTPHYLAKERGGKENMSSTYTLGKITPIPEAKTITRTALSPVRPSSSNVARQSKVITIPRKSVLREAHARPVSQAGSTAGSTHERHSRRSLHSRHQSRVSGTKRTPRGHSRSQSSAFPFFDPNVTEADADADSTTPALTSPPTQNPTKASSITRDLSGNLTYHGHGSETLGSSSILSTPAPQNPTRSSAAPSGVPARQSVGLGLFPPGSSAAELNGERERNPLSVAGASVDVESAGTPKGRRTWGEGLKSMISRGSVWGWEKERDDVKVFV